MFLSWPCVCVCVCVHAFLPFECCWMLLMFNCVNYNYIVSVIYWACQNIFLKSFWAKINTLTLTLTLKELISRHHLEYWRHSIDEDSISVLTQEADWFRRGVAEAIHIQREVPTLNRGRERHTLPPIYQELLPATHQHSRVQHWPCCAKWSAVSCCSLAAVILHLNSSQLAEEDP